MRIVIALSGNALLHVRIVMLGQLAPGRYLPAAFTGDDVASMARAVTDARRQIVVSPTLPEGEQLWTCVNASRA
jgi:hypothetical protein